MIDQKTLISSKLKEIVGLTVYQIRPEVLSIAEFPIVTYFISMNNPDYDLDKTIGKQTVEVTLDIWGLDDSQTTPIMNEVISKLLEINYLCTHNIDVPDPENFSHLNLHFNY